MKRWDKKLITKIMNADMEEDKLEFVSESEEEQVNTVKCGSPNSKNQDGNETNLGGPSSIGDEDADPYAQVPDEEVVWEAKDFSF